MRTLVMTSIVAVVLALSAPGVSAQADSTAVDSLITPPPTPASTTTTSPVVAQTATQAPAPKKVFYGGSVGLSFGDYFSISVSPMMGYKVNKRVHVGATVTYEYFEDDRYASKVTGSNFGGSVFSRLFLRPAIYGHAEFEYTGFKYEIAGQESEREWVPFLLLGGGIVKPIGRNAAFTAEVLFDVLQDENSPYDDWEPRVSVGVVVGI